MSQRGSKSGNFCSRVARIPSFTMIIDRLNSKWKYIESIIEKNDKYLDSLRDQISRLEYRLTVTYSIQKKEEIKGWISEKFNKIKTVESKNESLYKEIEDVKQKIIYYRKL